MIFRILAKNVANITEASFHLSRLKFCREKCFGEKEFNTFGLSGENSQNFGSRESKRNFWGNNFCIKKVIRIIFWLWERTFQTFTQKFPAEVSEQHSTYPEDECQERKFGSIQFSDFLGHRAKSFGHYAKSFLQDYKLCILLAQRGVFGRKFCFKFALHIHRFQAKIGAGLLHKTFR